MEPDAHGYAAELHFLLQIFFQRRDVIEVGVVDSLPTRLLRGFNLKGCAREAVCQVQQEALEVLFSTIVDVAKDFLVIFSFNCGKALVLLVLLHD